MGLFSRAFQRKNKNASETAKEKFNLGLSYASFIPIAILAGIKLTGHTVRDSMQGVFDSFDGIGNAVNSIGSTLGKIPLVGGILGAPFKLTNAVGSLIETVIMWLPTAMGNAFDVLFTLVAVVVAIRGVSDIVARYQVEKELLRGDMRGKSNAAIVTQSSTVQQCNTEVISSTDEDGGIIVLEKNEDNAVKALEKNGDYEELSIYDKRRNLSAFTRDRETQRSN
ncbi:MAG: hypothetical protein NC393_10260 [Clostridium sp.]|nr:hypothetical protein [Clostridium sp.]MCM1207485.1 hypothetical protein [Ruminococcus sp.]